MLEQYVPLGIYIGVLVILALLMVGISHLLSPRRVPTSPEWRRAYECGLLSEGLSQDRYPIKYYLVAILFVVFDLEVVFLYPWAVSLSPFKQAGYGYFWFVEMLVFIVILLIGYFYIIAKGVFLWSEE